MVRATTSRLAPNAARPTGRLVCMAISQPTRDAAAVLLDLLSVLDDTAENPAILETAFARLNDIGAVKVEASPPGGVVTVDLTPLIGGALLLIKRLVDDTTARTESSQAEVIHELRVWLQKA